MVGGNGNSRWSDALLDRMRKLGDPVADVPVAAMLERGGVDAVTAGFKLERDGELAPFDIPDHLARN